MDTYEGHFIEVYIQYPKKVNHLHNDSPFFFERMKIERHVFNGGLNAPRSYRYLEIK